MKRWMELMTGDGRRQHLRWMSERRQGYRAAGYTDACCFDGAGEYQTDLRMVGQGSGQVLNDTRDPNAFIGLPLDVFAVGVE